MIKKYYDTHINSFNQTFKNFVNEEIIKSMIENITKCIKNGNKIIIAGNGGSAADSQHFAAEFTGRYKLERIGIAAIALNTDSSALTAIGNDYGFNRVFSRQIEALGKKDDIFIGISTSGNSENIIKACNEAKKKGILTLGLLGKDGGLARSCFNKSIIVKSKDSARIQEAHIFIIHVICEEVEKKLFQRK
jgi:D-sedoheptulose 7-phosphate isomerase